MGSEKVTSTSSMLLALDSLTIQSISDRAMNLAVLHDVSMSRHWSSTLLTQRICLPCEFYKEEGHLCTTVRHAYFHWLSCWKEGSLVIQCGHKKVLNSSLLDHLHPIQYKFQPAGVCQCPQHEPGLGCITFGLACNRRQLSAVCRRSVRLECPRRLRSYEGSPVNLLELQSYQFPQRIYTGRELVTEEDHAVMCGRAKGDWNPCH